MAQSDFPNWLQAAMAQRVLDQSELSRRAQAAGFSISPHTISRILSSERQAGLDACIAISYGLGLSREEVFRARGWLLQEPEAMFPPSADPRLIQLGQQVSQLPPNIQDAVLEAWQATLNAAQVAQKDK